MRGIYSFSVYSIIIMQTITSDWLLCEQCVLACDIWMNWKSFQCFSIGIFDDINGKIGTESWIDLSACRRCHLL